MQRTWLRGHGRAGESKEGVLQSTRTLELPPALGVGAGSASSPRTLEFPFALGGSLATETLSSLNRPFPRKERSCSLFCSRSCDEVLSADFLCLIGHPRERERMATQIEVAKRMDGEKGKKIRPGGKGAGMREGGGSVPPNGVRRMSSRKEIGSANFHLSFSSSR